MNPIVAPAVHTTNRKVAFLRVDTAGPNVQVYCAGAYWAGRSELPLAQISAPHLVELKADPRLTVTEIERDPEPEAPAAEGA